MNCREGDLARVITAGPFQDKLIVVTQCFDSGYGMAWEFQEAPIHFAGGWQWSFFDRVLRPIRDPGDDAVDETLLLIPSPVETA